MNRDAHEKVSSMATLQIGNTVHNLKSGVYSIGRDTSEFNHDITINDASVDIKHAALEIDECSVKITDLFSKNGTKVGHNKIEKMNSVNLEKTATILFGSVTATLHITIVNDINFPKYSTPHKVNTSDVISGTPNLKDAGRILSRINQQGIRDYLPKFQPNILQIKNNPNNKTNKDDRVIPTISAEKSRNDSSAGDTTYIEGRGDFNEDDNESNKENNPHNSQIIDGNNDSNLEKFIFSKSKDSSFDESFDLLKLEDEIFQVIRPYKTYTRRKHFSGTDKEKSGNKLSLSLEHSQSTYSSNKKVDTNTAQTEQRLFSQESKNDKTFICTLTPQIGNIKIPDVEILQEAAKEYEKHNDRKEQEEYMNDLSGVDEENIPLKELNKRLERTRCETKKEKEENVSNSVLNTKISTAAYLNPKQSDTSFEITVKTTEKKNTSQLHHQSKICDNTKDEIRSSSGVSTSKISSSEEPRSPTFASKINKTKKKYSPRNKENLSHENNLKKNDKKKTAESNDKQGSTIENGRKKSTKKDDKEKRVKKDNSAKSILKDINKGNSIQSNNKNSEAVNKLEPVGRSSRIRGIPNYFKKYFIVGNDMLEMIPSPSQENTFQNRNKESMSLKDKSKRSSHKENEPKKRSSEVISSSDVNKKRVKRTNTKNNLNPDTGNQPALRSSARLRNIMLTRVDKNPYELTIRKIAKSKMKL